MMKAQRAMPAAGRRKRVLYPAVFSSKANKDRKAASVCGLALSA
jgi:hypothetical protein